MKKQTSIQRALSLRKSLSARKKQRGSAIEWIIIVLLILAALVPLIMWCSHTMKAPPPDLHIVDGPIKKRPTDGLIRAGFDDLDDDDSEAASTESEPDTAQMASDVSSGADTASASGE